LSEKTTESVLDVLSIQKINGDKKYEIAKKIFSFGNACWVFGSYCIFA
jgi:hypothetical protein